MKKKFFYFVTGLVIVIFLYLLFSYSIANTDVDDAITSAVRAFVLDGKNPYQEDVVEHHMPSGIVYGRYHYFPPDLLTYSLFYIGFGNVLYPSLGTYWFVPFHFLLVIPSYWLITRIVDWPHHRRFPFSLLLLTPFLFTNSMLMLFFFLIGYYFFEEAEKPTIGMIFYVLAASVKYMVGIIIFFYLLQILRNIGKKRDLIENWRYYKDQFIPYITGSLVLIIISLPFGLLDVLVSVFLYQGDPSYRKEVAQSVGPLLIEFLNTNSLESLYLPIAGIIILILLILLRNHSTYDLILHFSFLAMLILPLYATELFITVPFYFWFKEGIKSFETPVPSYISDENSILVT
ncbi:MAG: hypothetical protein ACXAC8_10460 [Candidatus Hodarchaeales archaeon]|jgi:hypothetical protein